MYEKQRPTIQSNSKVAIKRVQKVPVWGWKSYRSYARCISCKPWWDHI